MNAAYIIIAVIAIAAIAGYVIMTTGVLDGGAANVGDQAQANAAVGDLGEGLGDISSDLNDIEDIIS